MLEVHANKKPDISLTPLIDVVFILLIFFMLIVQFKKYQQLPLAVANTSTSVPSETLSEITRIKLTNKGDCQIDADTIGCDQLLPMLRQRDTHPVLLQFDGKILLENILKTHQQLLDNGYEVHLATNIKRPGMADAN